MNLLRTTKEIARHLLYSFRFERVFRKARNVDHLNLGTVRERFSEIYRSGLWQNGDPDTPLSGKGSSLDSTRKLRNELPKMLGELGAHSILDVGCGDFSWMQQIDLGITYKGIDVVPSVVLSNQANFGSENRSFSVIDAINDKLPSCDVVICREVLFHLSLEDAFSVLKNIAESQPRYVILTTDGQTLFNSNIHSGDYRLLNLQKKPFSLGEPVHRIDESESLPGRILGFWTLEQIENAIEVFQSE